jgi:hypothetical protein
MLERETRRTSFASSGFANRLLTNSVGHDATYEHKRRAKVCFFKTVAHYSGCGHTDLD